MKTLAPLIMRLRLFGVQRYTYLDDLIVGDSEVEAAQSVQETLQVLIHTGFVMNLKKSEPSPHTRPIVYRGKVSHGPGQTIPTGKTDPGVDSLC